MGQGKLTKVMTQVLLTYLFQKGRENSLVLRVPPEQCCFLSKLLLNEGEGQDGEVIKGLSEKEVKWQPQALPCPQKFTALHLIIAPQHCLPVLSQEIHLIGMDLVWENLFQPIRQHLP